MKSTCIFLKGIFVIFFVILLSPVSAQHHEFGLGVGALNYAGDLSRGYNFTAVRPGGRIFYRYNFNPIISVRGFIGGGGLSGSDSNPIDPAADLRNASFNLSLIEFGGDFEYNFLDIKSAKSLNNWSPYLFFGVGGFVVLGSDFSNSGSGVSGFQPMIPFGTGVKIELGPRWSMDIEAGMRKLFTDKLDGISGGDPLVKNYQYGNKYDKDWYNFFGISVSYTIYSIDCPYDFYHTQAGK